MLRYGKPLPQTDALEGVYIDDHLVIGRVPLKELNSSTGTDRDLIDRSHEAYCRVGLQRAVDKAFGLLIEPSHGDQGTPTLLHGAQAWTENVESAVLRL